MNLMRIDPYREMQAFQDRINRAFGQSQSRREDEQSLGAWVPPVDIAEDKDRILITAELPGFQDNEISIQTENGMLSISGERKFERDNTDRNYHRVERSYGQFVRSFSLPNNVDRERIQATFRDGLLEIDLPKREDAKPRQIPVSAGAGRGPDTKGTIDVKSR
ncbi:MAG TPA: Hsp20/alpha crystallin family protein [Thermoanaerobaculia bacterium]|nr:Hsp20/alpha crystallin family protein [Thermoanaerobaculia bacterium]